MPQNADAAEVITGAEADDKPYELSPEVKAYLAQGKAEAETQVADEISAADGAAVDAGETAADPEVGAADAAQVTAPAAPWYDTRDLQYAQAHGLSEYDLQRFGGRDQFLLTTDYITRARAAQPQQAAAQATTAAVPEPVNGPFNADGTVNRKWCDEQQLDEVQMAAIEHTARANQANAELKQKFDDFRQTVVQQQQQGYFDAVHASIDKLAMPSLFGASTDANRRPAFIPANELSRRNEIYAEIENLQTSYQRRGARMPSLDQLAQHAASIVYREEIAAHQVKGAEAANRERLEALAKQSTRRRPVASSAGATSRKLPDDVDPTSSEAVLRKPDVAKWLAEKNERYGVT